MAQPHKHAEVIKAWANGAEIQFQLMSGGWCDAASPSWESPIVYRVKPEIYRFRVALLSDGMYYSLTVESKVIADIWDDGGKPGFIRWLTDWIEVEVG